MLKLSEAGIDREYKVGVQEYVGPNRGLARAERLPSAMMCRYRVSEIFLRNCPTVLCGSVENLEVPKTSVVLSSKYCAAPSRVYQFLKYTVLYV